MRASSTLLLTAALTLLLSGCTQPGTDGGTPTTSSGGGSPTTSSGTGSNAYGAPEPMHVHVGSGAFEAPATTLALGTRVDFHAHTAGHTVTIHKEGSPVPTMTDEEPAADEI